MLEAYVSLVLAKTPATPPCKNLLTPSTARVSVCTHESLSNLSCVRPGASCSQTQTGNSPTRDDFYPGVNKHTQPAKMGLPLNSNKIIKRMNGIQYQCDICDIFIQMTSMERILNFILLHACSSTEL